MDRRRGIQLGADQVRVQQGNDQLSAGEGIGGHVIFPVRGGDISFLGADQLQLDVGAGADLDGVTAQIQFLVIDPVTDQVLGVAVVEDHGGLDADGRLAVRLGDHSPPAQHRGVDVQTLFRRQG